MKKQKVIRTQFKKKNTTVKKQKLTSAETEKALNVVNPVKTPQSRTTAFKAFAEKQAAIPTLVKSKQKKQLVRRRAENRQAGALAAKAARALAFLEECEELGLGPAVARSASNCPICGAKL